MHFELKICQQRDIIVSFHWLYIVHIDYIVSQNAGNRTRDGNFVTCFHFYPEKCVNFFNRIVQRFLHCLQRWQLFTDICNFKLIMF